MSSSFSNHFFHYQYVCLCTEAGVLTLQRLQRTRSCDNCINITFSPFIVPVTKIVVRCVCGFSQHRRHFSAAVCEGHIYAVGGWYLDSLVTPDSTTGVYTAVERYDPWADSWTFVSSLPLTDFQFTLSLSHDSPLTTSLGASLYVLGNIQRTGEKLVLRYDTGQGVANGRFTVC